MTEAALIQVVWHQLKLDLPPTKAPSDCMIRCSLMPKSAERTQCITDCKAEAAVAELAARLHVELFKSFIEVIWAGGGIDPLPLEKAVRANFAQGARGPR